jgi:hypothetical protein
MWPMYLRLSCHQVIWLHVVLAQCLQSGCLEQLQPRNSSTGSTEAEDGP